MRLYPPVWLVERAAVEDDQFGDYRYPRGILLIAFLYGLHHDKTFWPDAERFLPERFMEEPDLVKSKYFYPFGAGPRMCIGNNFAMAELSFFVYRFFGKYRVQATTQVPKKVPLLTLRPDKILLEIRSVV
jgi:cytochrome P450